ncbi:MAG: ABC transporter ATP-binding protein [Bacteroidota bacterium]
MIELKDVVKKFGSFTAVDGVTLGVGKGELFGFLGPNGAGKTTTIKTMTGLLSPTSGHCLINGADVHRHPMEAKQMLAYVPDQPFLYDKLTGREFLYFLGGIFKMDPPAIRQGIDDLVETFGIGEFLDRRAEEYSQGMRQRIVIAGALLHEPLVLVIDEPLVGLDPRSSRLVKDALKARCQQGLTVFMSTHLLDIVEELCDRIAIINRGKIVHEQVRNEKGGFSGDLESLFLELTG